MEKSSPNNPNTNGIKSRIRRIFFRNGIKNTIQSLQPKKQPIVSDLQTKASVPVISEELQYEYEKYNALVEDIQKQEQQAILKLEKLGLGKYANDLIEAIYNRHLSR